ncbi:restriction endonuclease subunit S [Empedobacter sp. UBA7248]|uniref:restriction endonuclease subunit S n=1 Tax=Empedobacter sp. UBA7248 TaxID=1946448 RepID=UPI0025C433AD|nr:restriction endonuclease subunit S [Empedobacter sp. UBA7248]
MTNKKLKVDNVPNLRFPEFEGEWESKKLGEIGEIVNGLTYSPNDIAENGVLVLRSSNVQNRSLAFEDNVYVRTDIYNPVQESDILICVRNGSKNLIGKNALINKENEGIAFGAFMSIYRSVFNKFLFHWFDTREYKEVVHKNLGATINSINGSDLKLFKVPFPSVEEQQKIASFLSLIDERIQTQSKIIKELNVLKSAITKKIFLQEFRFKDGNGNEFPEWLIKKIGNVCSIIGGGTPETGKPEYWNGNIQWFTPTEIKSKFVSKSERKISESGLKNSSAKILPKGSLLLTTRATIGEVAIALSECTTNQGFQSLVVNKNCNNIFLYNWLQLNKFELEKRANGSTFPEISKSEIEKIEISLPNMDEQTKIANFLSSIDSKIEIETQLLQKLEEQKKFLLQQMFV